MRRSEIFKTLSVSVIVSDPIDRHVIVETLKLIGVRHYTCYMDFEDALSDLDKFYSMKHPDFILSEAIADREFPQGLVKSRLRHIPILMMTNPDIEPLIANKSEFPTCYILSKPIRYEVLRLEIMNMFKRKFKIY
jgi:hypothetical protein